MPLCGPSHATVALRPHEMVRVPPQVKRGYHILCKSTAAMPYMNRPIKLKTWRHRLWSWLDPPKKRVNKDIHSFPVTAALLGASPPSPASRGGPLRAPASVPLITPSALLATRGQAPASVKGNTVTFVDGSTYDADVIVFATGYRQRFPFLDESAGRCQTSTSGARGEEDPLPDEHFIVSPDEPTLAFLGFVRPNVGAIPPMAELQART